MTLFTGFWLAVYQFFIVGSFIGISIYAVGQVHALFKLGGWRSIQGRFLAFLGVSLTLAFLFLSLRIFFGDFAARPVVSMVLVILIFISIWWLTIMWAVGQYRNHKRKQRDHSK